MQAQAQNQAVHRFSLPTGNLAIEVTDAYWSFDSCMGVGARHNPKRGFLFVSKLLGKHIPVAPSLMKETHVALAKQLSPSLDAQTPTLFVAMAETATGLGHGVYEAALEQADGDTNWIFSTTTRYKMGDNERIEFKEDHSHAADQWLHLPLTGVPLDSIKTLVLVDDEISTGKTMMNLENSLRGHLPALEQVLWVTLTCLAKETARPCTYLLKGQYEFKAGTLGQMPGNAVGVDQDVSHKLSANWGRLGVKGFSQLGANAKAALAEMAKLKWDKPVLVLGQGEFMHAAFRMGQELERLGVNCRVQSTTRSPIMTYGAIGCARAAVDPVGNGVNHYVYNLDPDAYSLVIIAAEASHSVESYELAKSLDTTTLVVVVDQ